MICGTKYGYGVKICLHNMFLYVEINELYYSRYK